MIETTVAGGYPKTLEDQKIRKALRRVDEGAISAEELSQIFDQVTISALREQVEAGLDCVADGCLRWDDEVTYVARGLQGIQLSGLIRFFDTNVLYRQPVVVGKVAWTGPMLVRDFLFAREHAARPLKAMVTGPFTIMRFSRDAYYHDAPSLYMDLCAALNAELLALGEVGAAQIHINEPAIHQAADQLPLFHAGMGRLLQGVRSEVTLYCSFGDVSDLLASLLDLEVATLGIDFTYVPDRQALLARVPRGVGGKRLLAGIIDARNTRLETKEEVHGMLELLVAAVGSERLAITPSANLEFLPLDRCRRKLRNMVELVKAFGGN